MINLNQELKQIMNNFIQLTNSLFLLSRIENLIHGSFRTVRFKIPLSVTMGEDRSKKLGGLIF